MVSCFFFRSRISQGILFQSPRKLFTLVPSLFPDLIRVYFSKFSAQIRSTELVTMKKLQQIFWGIYTDCFEHIVAQFVFYSALNQQYVTLCYVAAQGGRSSAVVSLSNRGL